jgi:hypothetical protein
MKAFKTYIALNHCCAEGLEIVLKRDRAWERHDHAGAIRWRMKEQEHLEICAHCNPEIQSKGLLAGLWPGKDVKVAE